MKQVQQWDIIISDRLSLTPINAGWPLAAKIAHLGDGNIVFGSLGLLYLLSWLFSSPTGQAIAITLLITLLATAILIFIIKYTLRRERPRDPTGFVTISYDKYSFPSGHAARMSCLAITLFTFNWAMGLILLVLALCVAVARIVVGVHYLSDVIVGLGVGAITATLGVSLIRL